MAVFTHDYYLVSLRYSSNYNLSQDGWTLKLLSVAARPDGVSQMMIPAQNVLDQNDNLDVNKPFEHMTSTQLFLQVKLCNHWLKHEP